MADFEYNNKTEKSYLDKKLKVPDMLDYQEKHFLGLVEGPIERTLTKLIRVKAADHLNRKPGTRLEQKEFLVWMERWDGKDWQGKKIAPVSDHVEGKYMEQDTEPKVYQNKKIGETRTGQHEVHYVPFSRKAIDEVVTKADQLDPGLTYVIKGPQFRNGQYSYEQFTTSTWDEAIEMMMTNGGPQVHAYNQLKQKQQQAIKG